MSKKKFTGGLLDQPCARNVREGSKVYLVVGKSHKTNMPNFRVTYGEGDQAKGILPSLVFIQTNEPVILFEGDVFEATVEQILRTGKTEITTRNELREHVIMYVSCLRRLEKYIKFQGNFGLVVAEVKPKAKRNETEKPPES